MSDIKKVGAQGGEKKKGSAMGDAVKGTEAIRTWDDHKIGPDALAKRFNTTYRLVSQKRPLKLHIRSMVTMPSQRRQASHGTASSWRSSQASSHSFCGSVPSSASSVTVFKRMEDSINPTFIWVSCSLL